MELFNNWNFTKIYIYETNIKKDFIRMYYITNSLT